MVELCDRSLSDVFFAGTHNSMSAQEENWLAPNHIYAIPDQLNDGIRALNIDTYWWQEEAFMCHGYCEIGAQPLRWATDAIVNFLAEKPNSVLIITLQSNLIAEETLVPFVASGLESELYHHQQEEWPTLADLIDARQRIVLFSDTGGGTIEGYMSQWEHWVDNPYSAQDVSDFACHIDRGDRETATLYNINHFLTNPIAQPTLAEQANTYDVLKEHVSRCIAETGQKPNQLLVDFYSIGTTLRVVNEYNSSFE